MREKKTFKVKLLPERQTIVKTEKGQAATMNLSLDRMFSRYVEKELRKNDSKNQT